MRGLFSTTMLSTAALVAAVVLYVWLTTPRAALVLDDETPPTQVTGAYHVHTSRSDGTGTPDEIAAAAARAGLAFVIFTDHSDGTRTPDPPAYRDGVLCIDAAEISTSAGHLVALGLTSATPYPLSGQPRDVIDDIRRFGGVAIIAHPDSPKDDLRWRAQNVRADGIEWLNADSEWRDDRPVRLVSTAARAFFRAPESIVSLFSRPARSIQRWDTAAGQGPTFGIVALDAHANISWTETDEPRRRTAFARPTYETMFRVAGQSALLDAPLTGNAAMDAVAVTKAIATGASFSIIRGLADPATFTFTADQGGARARMGGALDAAAPFTTLRAVVPEAPGARLILNRDGRPIASGYGQVQLTGPTSPGVYRVEATLPDSSVPWLMSNPIAIGRVEILGPPEDARLERDAVRMPASAGGWAIEHDPLSSGTVTDENREIRFGYRLGPFPKRGQFAALVTPVDSQAGVDRVQFVGRADRPMRVSVQMKLPGSGRDGQRWRRSVYLDTTPRRVTLNIQEFDPADTATQQRPIVTNVRTVLFVVDTVNTAAGREGSVWISDVALGTREP